MDWICCDLTVACLSCVLFCAVDFICFVLFFGHGVRFGRRSCNGVSERDVYEMILLSSWSMMFCACASFF